MYKIFINEIPVIIMEGNSAIAIEIHNEKNPVYFFTQRKEIQKAFELIETGNYFRSLTIVGEDAKEIKNVIFSSYKKIVAAGGLVINKKKEILMIYRLGNWDLPKGKLNLGEKKKKAALREVREETGLKQLELLHKLKKTYHTYVAADNLKILKITHWYLMSHYDETTPVPQIEENIDVVKWVQAEQLEEKLKQAYGSIRDVVDAGIISMHLL